VSRFTSLRTAVTQGLRIGGMYACGWSHVYVDSGPVALCGPVALYLLQLPSAEWCVECGMGKACNKAVRYRSRGFAC